jgi:hypothetical protein
MIQPIAESYLLLLWTEIVMVFQRLGGLHRRMLRRAVAVSRPGTAPSQEELCTAMDLACVLYPKRVLCLQRSAATTFLLRRHGIDAQMILGARMMPFKSHAWVEVDGAVVNDKPYMREIYQELERC